jgi:hypothetical protein
MDWTLLLFAYIGLTANNTPPAPVLVHQVDFATEQLCSEARTKLGQDWAKSLNGKESNAPYYVTTSCIRRR